MATYTDPRKFEKVAAPLVDKNYLFKPTFERWRAFWISPFRGKEFLQEARKDEKLLDKIKHSDLPVYHAMKNLYFKMHDFGGFMTQSKANTAEQLKAGLQGVVASFNDVRRTEKANAELIVSPGFKGHKNYLVNRALLNLIVNACMENAHHTSVSKIKVEISQDGLDSIAIRITPGIRDQTQFKLYLIAAFELKACDEVTGGEMSVNSDEVTMKVRALN